MMKFCVGVSRVEIAEFNIESNSSEELELLPQCHITQERNSTTSYWNLIVVYSLAAVRFALIEKLPAATLKLNVFELSFMISLVVSFENVIKTVMSLER